MILANALYIQSDLRELGIGRESLALARKSGIVVPCKFGGAYFYHGSEIIEFISKQRVEQVTKHGCTG